MPVLSSRGRLYRASKVRSNQLHSVANTEDRNVELLKEIRSHTGSSFICHARWSAREDHALRPPCQDLIDAQVKRMDLAINSLLANAPRDQLGILRAEIENEDEFVLHYKCTGGNLDYIPTRQHSAK